jgi:fibronectin type 3 domain-containing protein
MVAGSTGVAAPSNLSVDIGGPRNIELSWTDNDPSATGYWIYRSSDGQSWSAFVSVAAGSTGYTDSTAAPYESRFYEVIAFNGLGTSAVSNVAEACVSLVAPTGLTATEISSSKIQLNWQDNDTAATEYKILRSTNGGAYTQIADLKTTGLASYLDATVSPLQHYSYQVQAYYVQNLSGPSNIATTSTSLFAPSGLTATTAANNSIHLTWADNDADATGYYVLRSTDGQNFSSIATLTSAKATSYTDSTAAASQTYEYEIQAFNGASTSAVSNMVAANASLGTPTGLTAAVLSPSSVKLTWVDNDSTALGYYILRSMNGGAFSQIASVTGGKTNSYTDSSAFEYRSFSYEVEAYKSAATSAASNPATVTMPLIAPTNITATDGLAGVTLNWTQADMIANGYQILRSTDGVNYTSLATVSSGSTTTYTDGTVVAGHKYYYEVKATYMGTSTSLASSAASITPAGKIVIFVRYGDELVIDATGSADTVSLSQSGSTLTILADGQTYTEAIPAAGVFLYTRGGVDHLTIASSVNAFTTVETIDGAMTTITSAGTDVLAWIDSTDSFTGTGTVERVASFAGGVSKAYDAALANPSLPTGGYSQYNKTSNIDLSLFGTGPVADDVNQGAIGDCYFLSSLAAFAQQNPGKLEQSAVDMGDGTYDVRFYNNGVATDVRVSNTFINGPYDFGQFLYAHPGANNTIWEAVMEKAFCYFTTGANTYDSILAGGMEEVYGDLNVSQSSFTLQPIGDSALFSQFSTALANHDEITLASSWPSLLVSGHAYTLTSVYTDSNGVNEYVVRNPWGCSGVPLENNLGYATLTYAQFMQSFVGETVSTS